MWNVVGFVDMTKYPPTAKGYTDVPESFWRGEAMSLDAALTRANRLAMPLWDAQVANDPRVSDALSVATRIKVYKQGKKARGETKAGHHIQGLVEVCAQQYGSRYMLHYRLMAFPTGLRWVKVHEFGADVNWDNTTEEYQEAKRELSAMYDSSGRV